MRVRLATIVATTCLATALAGSEARAQCIPGRAKMPGVASEARRARWLIGDDARFQAQLDDDRHRFTEAMKTVDAEDRSVQVFAATAFALQVVWPFDVCTTDGNSHSAGFERWRGAATVGVTHADTGLHARVSVVGALDQLNLATSDESRNARAGTTQLLVATRFGHERYFKLILGYIGADTPFNQPGSGDVTLARERATAPAHGTFVGATIPMMRTSMVTLIQNGRTELFSVLARDLRPGQLPFTFSLGPTYIREERQAVGLVRFRSLSHEFIDVDRDDVEAYDNEVHKGGSVEHTTVGPMLELSAESRDARIRHGRFRVQADTFGAFGGSSLRRLLHASIYAEGTFFRSRFFSESFATPTDSPRGTAWGLGGGLSAGIAIAPVFVSLDGHAGWNRPELLSLLPSAADRPELRLGLSLRFEN